MDSEEYAAAFIVYYILSDETKTAPSSRKKRKVWVKPWLSRRNKHYARVSQWGSWWKSAIFKNISCIIWWDTLSHWKWCNKRIHRISRPYSSKNKLYIPKNFFFPPNLYENLVHFLPPIFSKHLEHFMWSPAFSVTTFKLSTLKLIFYCVNMLTSR